MFDRCNLGHDAALSGCVTLGGRNLKPFDIEFLIYKLKYCCLSERYC